MCRSIIIYSTLFTLIVTTCSKSIRTRDREAVESTIPTSFSDISKDLPPIHEESKYDNKLNAKRDILIVTPTTEKEEDVESKGPKTKRCKMSFLGETVGSPMSKTLESKNTERSLNDERESTHLVSLKNPTARKKLESLSEQLEKAKNATFRDDLIINSLRKQLRPNDPIIGASRGSLVTKTNVFDDGKFVCYCREKDQPPVKSKNVISKAQAKKNKVGKRIDDKKVLLGSRHRVKPTPKPILPNIYHSPIISKKIPPAYYPHIPHLPQPYTPKHLPYIPYIHQPKIPTLPHAIHKGIPPRFHAPFNPIGGRPDLMVGQRAPIDQQQDINENQQTVGQTQCPPNIVGQSLHEPAEKIVPTTFAKPFVTENTPSNDEKDSTGADYNLQSVRSESSVKNRSKSPGKDELPTELPNVQAVNPADFNEKSSTGLENESTNEYETTGSGTVDYSDIEEVTTAYFTSMAYTNETGHGDPTGYDDFHITSTGHMNPEENQDDNLQSPLNVPAENSIEPIKTLNDEDSMFRNVDPTKEEEKTVLVGKSNPYSSQEEPANDGSNVKSTEENNYGFKEAPTMEDTSELILGATRSPNEDTSIEINDKDPPTSGEFSAEDYATESPEEEDNAGPLRTDYVTENFGSDRSGQKIDEEDDPVNDPITKETIHPDDDYTTIGEDLVNTENDEIGKKQTTTINDNENEDISTTIESTLKSSEMNDARGTNDSSLPFCDNTLLQKSIKTVINNFATGDSGETGEETVGAAKGEDLLPEIVGVPNLKGILSMPQIENTVLDKVKNLVSTLTGVTRKNFDNDWATNVIKNNLHHAMAAAPNSKLEPTTVEEHQFKNGKWVTNIVTLEPPTNVEASAPTDLEKLQNNVKSLLRNPAVSFQAAKNPAVQNMIVQSVKHNFKPGNERNGEDFDDSVIRSTLNDELSIMEMEDKENTTTENVEDTATKADDLDMSNIDMNKLLDIAKSEAEGEDKEELSTSKIIATTVEPLDRDLVGAKKESDPSRYFKGTTIYPIMETNQATVELSKGNEVPKSIKKVAISELESTTLNMEELEQVARYNPISTESSTNVVAATPRNQDESLTVKVEDYTYVQYSSSTINPRESIDNMDENMDDSTETLVGMENTSVNPEISTDGQDYTYLGKISVENKNNPDDVQSLRNSELFYTGDGVKLPLEIRKLKDGSYALSISRKVCEHLLNKECPCCVPVKGNVVRTVRRNSDERNADDRTIDMSRGKRISKRDAIKSISPNEREKSDSADDSLQIFTMPVETFARRYNLSLNLEKVQTPRNFDDVRGKIDENVRDRRRNFRNKERNNDGIDLSQDLFSVHGITENPKSIPRKRRINNDPYENEEATSYEDQVEDERNFETYRYQRNIDVGVDKRVEIMKNLLNWIRDIILDRSSER
ncbi:hypothetical protein ANTPLA_LOCUS140 [Anthophora plagiata]